MIPLTLACILGGCLDVPIDNRPIHRQILEDQFSSRTKPNKYSCYRNGEFYVDCSHRD